MQIVPLLSILMYVIYKSSLHYSRPLVEAAMTGEGSVKTQYIAALAGENFL